MTGELEVISVNLWQVLISLCNLLIMFLVLKHFLFKPVREMLAKRQSQVDDIYAAADEDRKAAGTMKDEYEQHLAAAREEADGLVNLAKQTAQRQSEAIVNEASAEAAHMKQKAAQEIMMERRQMMADVRSEISDMAVSIASKVIEREIKEADHTSLVDEFIQNVGERQ